MPTCRGPHWAAAERNLGDSNGQQVLFVLDMPRFEAAARTTMQGSLARDLPETALHIASRRLTTQPSTTPLTCSVAWVGEVMHGVVNHPSINGMQEVRCQLGQRAIAPMQQS